MKIKLLSEGAKVPTKADQDSAGFDLYVPKDSIIYPGRNVVPLGFALAIEPGWEGHIRPRSGFSAKGMEAYVIDSNNNKIGEPLRINADVIQGTIDASYRGNVGVIVHNHCEDPYIVEQGTRIAQMVIGRHYAGDLNNVVEELDETDRGEGGFGHSGTK